MCDFFSAIVFRTGQIRFCEDPSHETIIARLGLNDAADLFTRGLARVECVAPFAAVRVDETSTPGWYGEDRAAIDGRVMDLAQRIAPLWATCEAGRASLEATYQAGRASLWDAYQAGRAPLLATYGRVMDLAQRIAPLWATCEAGRAPLLAAYADGIRSIEGYVPAVVR